MIEPALIDLGIALALGLLVGLQRETVEDSMAGLRTFALITMLGWVLGTIDAAVGGWWLSAAGIGALAILLGFANVARWRLGDVSPGMTTEVAAVLMAGVGMLLASGERIPAVVVAGTVAVLLHFKARLHGLVDRIGEAELRGIMHLVLIALVVLPILPDRTFGPYDVLSPQNIWRMVVLIAGISLAAFLVHRWLGATRGAVVGGILGGLISSTATTVSYARQARPGALWPVTLVVLIASTIVNFRIMVELAVVNRDLFVAAAGPMGVLTAGMIALCVWAGIRSGREGTGIEQEHDNPAQIRVALVFGALYAGILLAVAAVRDLFGEQALYAVAVVSGLTDVDAITLSTARLQETGATSLSTSWRVVMVAVASNLAFKSGAIAVLGGRRLWARAGVLLTLSIALAVLLALFWPGGPLLG